MTEGTYMGPSDTDILASEHALPRPHGGRLIHRVLSQHRRSAILEQRDEFPAITVDNDVVSDLRNIAEGVFSPLEGFMEQQDFLHVIQEGRLADGTPWTIPIIFDLPTQSDRCSVGDEVLLRSESGLPLALLTITELYSFDKKEAARLVFGTDDTTHPGVVHFLTHNDTLMGGPIALITRPTSRFEPYHLSPRKTRAAFRHKHWKTVAGFQTRNVPHLGHEYLLKTSLTFVDGLFVNPIIGKKKRGDFKDEVILDAYEALITNYFPKERVVVGILETEMQYAGPKEAIFHAIIRKNYGCTHFIVGRDHAGVEDFYPPYAAHEIFEEYPDLGITPICFPSVFLCDRCKTITNDKTCPHSQICRQDFSGTQLRTTLQSSLNQATEQPIVRPEVAARVSKWTNPLTED